MNKKPSICIIGGSIRNRANQDTIVEAVKDIKSEPLLYEYIEHKAREKQISNSEGCAVAATYGALQENVEVKYLRLKDYFQRSGKTRNLHQLFEMVEESDGVIFALPVYFGDRPSPFDEFIDHWRKGDLNLSQRIFGFLSVGAKRNGGQETTNIYGIHDVTDLGGLAVGNGPATSQFGGTAVGGNIGTIESDYLGIMTSQGTGKRVAEISKIFSVGKESAKEKTNEMKVKIAFLVLQEKETLLGTHVRSIIRRSNLDNLEIDIINLNDYSLNRCYACTVCPGGDRDKDYSCINHKDDMKQIHKKLVGTDGLILCGLCLKDIRNVKNAYQTFIERTRYLRRDDFRLTNRLISTLSLDELGTNSLFGLRAVTSFIRHNTVIHKSIHSYYKDGDIIECDSESILKSFVESTRYLAKGREVVDIGAAHYSPIGYQSQVS